MSCTKKEKYNYIVNFEAYAHQKMVQAHRDSKQQIRGVAKKVADYLDEQAHYSVLRKEITRKAEKLSVEVSSLKEFKSLYSQSVARDKKAHDLWADHKKQVSDVPLLSRYKDDIQRASERHERYLVIKALVMHKTTDPLSLELIQHSGKIDIGKDKIHVMQLASMLDKKPDELVRQIQNAQKSNRNLVFGRLTKDYPVLGEFDKLLTDRGKISGFKAEPLDKLLLTKAREIIKDKKLYAQLQRDLPKWAQSLSLRIKNHDLGLEKDR